MEKNVNQFVIYPHDGNNQNVSNLTPQDKLIYLAIRRYMNKDNMEAFPSYARLTQDIGASSKTLKKCIDNLVSEGYITTFKRGRSIVYKFNNKKQFEPFSYEFLDNKNLSFTEKSYIVASQQHMFKDKYSEEGIIVYQNKELAKLINMSESTISRCNHSLKEKNYLGDRPINSKQLELKTQIHYFDNDGEIDGDKKIFSVDNKGDFINIQKLMQQTPEKYNLQKIDWWSSNQIAKPSIVESKDLSEIIVFRNSLVEQEVKFGKLVDNLLTEFNNQMAKSRNTVSVEESQSDSASQTQPTKQHNNWMDVLINSVSTAPVVTY